MNFFEKMIEIAKSMGVKDFAYYKKWALDHLKKQLDEDKTVAKAIEWCEEYMEKAYGVGTIRTWKGKKYIKGPDKKWRRYYDKKSRGTSQAIAYIMKEISSLENGDVEGLYNIIQKNAGRFRDENGNVLPEVQQIHDLVEKKQSGTTEKNSRVEEKKDVSKMSREEIISEMAKQVKLKTNRDENYYNELRNELDKYNQAVENARNESGNKINVDDFQLSKIGKKIDGEYPRFNNEQQKRLFSRIVDQYGETDKARTLLSKLVDFNSQKNESLEINPYGDSWDYMKKQAAYEPKESEINTKIENYLKEEKQKKDKELNISDSDINSLTDIDYLKDLQKKVVKENNRLHAEKKYDESNDMARRNYVISDRIKQLESEQEKHDNRSNAMTGNQNAKKEENTGYTITNKNGVKLTRENALKRINGSLDTARASLKTYEESIKNSDISMKVAAETQINMSLNHAKDLIGRLKPEDKKELETELKKLSDELEDLRKYNTNKVKESEMRNQDQKSQYNKMLEQFKSEVSDEKKRPTKELKSDIAEWKDYIDHKDFGEEKTNYLKELVKVGEAELKRREEKEDEKELQINVAGVKNAIKGKSEIEVKKYFNWAEKRFADKPENSIERRAIARAKAEYYGDTVFENKNIEKGIKEVASTDKVNKYVKDTSVESFCSKDQNRFGLTGVYNDPDGYKVATEGHILFAEKTDIAEEMAGKITFKNGVTNEGNFPNWKKVIPEDAPKTDLFDNKKELLKLCLLGNRISKINKKAPCLIKVGKHFYDTNYLGKTVAIAEKQGLNNVTITDRGQILFSGEKGMATVMGMTNDSAISYLDAKDKMYYGEQSDETKEFLGTEKDRFDPKLEEETKQIDKEESLKAEKYAKEVAEKNKEYEKYDMRLGYHKIHGNWYYTVDSKIDGRWIEGGHNYVTTKATAESIAERTYARKKQAAEYDQINKERIEREEKAKQERVEGYGTFLSGKDAKTKAREMAQLEKRVNFGNGKVMSYKEYIDEQFANGDLDVGTHEENKLKGPSRRAYNRMDGRQQEEYERRIKDAGKKTVYEIKSKSKSGYYELGKIAYDYAKYLIDNGGIKKSFLEQIEEISKSMNKAEPKHDLEYYKKWALSILDKQKEEPEEEDEPNEETIVKALAYTEMIAKAGYPVGTIREWKGKKYIKVAPNQWKPKYDSVNRGAKMSLGHLKKAVSNANSEEELYNIINTNASRFRDENGRPFPEVQELHDLVTKRQGELNPAENGNSGEEIGGESKGKENAKGKGKEKMSYADKIAAIQKMGKKAESAVQNTGSGHVDNAIENAANDVVDSTKNAAAKEEKKKVAAQKKTSEPGMSEEEKDKWLSQFEKDSSNSEKNDVKSEDVATDTRDSAANFTKLQLNQAYNMIGMKGSQSLEQFKKRIQNAPETPKNKATLMIINKLESMGDTQESMDKIYDAIQNGTLDSLGNNAKEEPKEETFESLTEQYNATKDPDEREKLLNKIMALEETKKEKISEMKEENEKEQGYSEKTKEEIDNMNREEYHQYMSRSQKTIPLDKIGYGGGHVTDLDNAYKMCQKIAETYGDTPEGIDKLNTFLIYNTNTASRMYDELNEKLGIDYALLDADHNLAYKNAMKTLLGTKTKKDSEKEKNAVGKYEDRMSAALKKLL